MLFEVIEPIIGREKTRFGGNIGDASFVPVPPCCGMSVSEAYIGLGQVAKALSPGMTGKDGKIVHSWLWIGCTHKFIRAVSVFTITKERAFGWPNYFRNSNRRHS